MKMRKIAALAVLAGSAAMIIYSTATPAARRVATWDGPNPDWFIRTPDTVCAVASDTLTGPSMYCFNARQVMWLITANSGTCSTFTAQVSMNDTNWFNLAQSGVTSMTSFTVGDSLNRKGEYVLIQGLDNNNSATGSSLGLPWKYSRISVRRRTGMIAGEGNTDATARCVAKVDSLRFTAYVDWDTPQ